MCAYNKLNGTFCSEHHRLLTDILKDEWGFEGFVVSDWGAVHDRVAALKAGLDLEMPGPRHRRVQAVVDAVRSGELDEAVLDESVRRILRIVFKAQKRPKAAQFDGQFDGGCPPRPGAQDRGGGDGAAQEQRPAAAESNRSTSP